MALQATNSRDLKRALLRLLEKDEEVQKHVLHLVIESEVIRELRGLRQDFQREMKQLREEMDKRFAQQQEYMDKRFEAQQAQIQELRQDMNNRFETQQKEMDKRFAQQQEYMDKRFMEAHNQMTRLGQRWGIQTEEAIRTFAQSFLASEFNIQAERWRYRDAELDVVIKNKTHTVIEVKSQVSEEEVKKFVRNLSRYEKKTGKKPKRKLLITAHANSQAYKLALKEGIEIISG